jgi:hypothetical protein
VSRPLASDVDVPFDHGLAGLVLLEPAHPRLGGAVADHPRDRHVAPPLLLLPPKCFLPLASTPRVLPQAFPSIMVTERRWHLSDREAVALGPLSGEAPGTALAPGQDHPADGGREGHPLGVARSLSLDREGKLALHDMAVDGQHAELHPIDAGFERRHGDRQPFEVVGADLCILEVDLRAVAIPHREM